MANGEESFWRAAVPLLAQDGVTRSTMMGLPCLRVRGKFCAAFDRSTGDLMVKLPATRVEQLIASGEGGAVAPAGRRFREWVAISASDIDHWPGFLTEASAFVGQS